MATKLRAVAPDETAPEKQRPLTTVEAARANDRLAELQAMRIRGAQAIDDPQTPPRDLSSLMRRQSEMGREVEALMMAAEQEANGGRIVADEAWDETAI